MKKLIAIFLVCFLAFALVACGGDEESSAPAFGNNSSQSADEGSKSETSKTESSADASKDESDEASDEVSDEASDEVSEDEGTPTVEFTNKYISWGGELTNGGLVAIRATDATSIKISKINDVVGEGDVGVFTYDFGSTIRMADQDYSEFAVAVFEYDHSTFAYMNKSFAAVGEADAETEIPEDGYVLVVHSSNTSYVTALTSAVEDSTNQFYPHGIIINDGLHTTIDYASSAPVIDGNVSKSEYGDVIWEIEPDNTLVNYAQFEVNNYYATAEVYATYDDEYFYFGVIVDSPYHENSLTAANAGSMYNYESIQVNITSVAPNGDYISEHWDNIIDPTAANSNVVRQYGFCVNDDGETLTTMWMGQNTDSYTVEAVCIRDDANGKTYYEVAIPWSDCGSAENPVDVTEGSQFGFSVSINSGNNTFKNILLRDGGGIIGLNDWTKVPVITFGE